jgi:branched-chain amino acid transport system substrate-binding protein
VSLVQAPARDGPYDCIQAWAIATGCEHANFHPANYGLAARYHPARLRRAFLICLFIALPASAAAGCGTDQSRGGQVPGDTLTIYSSLPLQGAHRAQAQSIVNAEKLALKEAGGRAGDFTINFASRDDSTAGDGQTPGWNPGRTADNASKAAQDSRTIAYIGEFDSGATAISLPVTNEASIVQVSPAATAVGLTKLVPGAEKGEPERFYPTGERTFARVVPADDVQAKAEVSWAKDIGARRVFLVDDRSVEGRALAEQVRIASEGKLDVVGRKGMDPRADDYADLAREIAGKNPDLVYFGGGVESNTLRFWQDMHAAAPNVRLMGSDLLLVPDFYEHLGSAAALTYLTSATKDPSRLPASGQRFLREYRRQFGQQADPYAAYGHASMALLLDVLRRLGDKASKREEVVNELLNTRNFDSVIGRFSLDVNGDTDLDEVAGYRVRNGRLVFVKPLRG